MCRKSQLQGWALIALGVGLFFGTRLEDRFLVALLGLGALAFGICLLRKK